MIKKEDIEHLASLSRINITDKEKEALRKETEAILDYVGGLGELNLDKVSPMTHAQELINVLREDAEGHADRNVSKKIVDSFPEKEGDYLKVKKVFEKDD